MLVQIMSALLMFQLLAYINQNAVVSKCVLLLLFSRLLFMTKIKPWETAPLSLHELIKVVEDRHFGDHSFIGHHVCTRYFVYFIVKKIVYVLEFIFIKGTKLL